MMLGNRLNKATAEQIEGKIKAVTADMVTDLMPKFVQRALGTATKLGGLPHSGHLH